MCIHAAAPAALEPRTGLILSNLISRRQAVNPTEAARYRCSSMHRYLVRTQYLQSPHFSLLAILILFREGQDVTQRTRVRRIDVNLNIKRYWHKCALRTPHTRSLRSCIMCAYVRYGTSGKHI